MIQVLRIVKGFDLLNIEDFFQLDDGLIPRTHGPFNVYSAERLDLFARCVRLSWLLVGFRTHFKSSHFHSFIHGEVTSGS